MTEYRTLAAHEYPQLATVADGFVPQWGASVAILAKDHGRNVGRVFLVAPTHLEGIWVDEKYRGRNVGYRLMCRAEEEARICGIKRLFAYGASSELEGYLTRLGYSNQPLTVWAKELR